MEIIDTLRSYGLFDAKVPRYTSYPPANRFQPDIGKRYFQAWLASTLPNEPVSVYVHIPFCRRLCWFCACRTQGTKTLAPVETYLEDLLTEIGACAAHLPKGLKMARLHLGGGTPTLLRARQMDHLLGALFDAFQPTGDFEFSVEIDPTEASDEVLACLGHWRMSRASIGIQDFNPSVQHAIGRSQGLEQTGSVMDRIRNLGVRSLNIDLLYGLPHQTVETLQSTLDKVAALKPDRLALYGYAHVPQISKRQVMIPAEALPSAEKRYAMAQMAKARLLSLGYVALGIDHFAQPDDSLAKVAQKGAMRRNFQGYTDDPCVTLLGFGASAISAFPQGYSQNAVSTAAYRERINRMGIAAHRGVVLSDEDKLLSELISRLMCDGGFNIVESGRTSSRISQTVWALARGLASEFPAAVSLSESRLSIRPGFECLARIISTALDRAHHEKEHIHSVAI